MQFKFIYLFVLTLLALVFELLSVSDLPFLVLFVFSITAFFVVTTKRAAMLYYAFSLGCFLFLFIDYWILWGPVTGLDAYKEAVELSVYSFFSVSAGFYLFSFSGWRLSKGGGIFLSNIKGYYFLLIFFLLLFLVVGGGLALATFKYGRQFVALNSDVGSLGRGLQVVLAIVIPFYASVLINKEESSRYEKAGAGIAVFLVALVLFFQGNRYPILLSLAPFFLHNFVGLRNPSAKSIVKISIFLIVGILASNYVVSYRENSAGLSYYDTQRYAFGVLKSEGILASSQKMINYFDGNSFKYGASLFAVCVFWVPSSLWPDKPSQIGYWLPRAYDGSISATHSSSFGFYGVFYSDFGFWGAIAFSFLIGVGLSLGSRFYSRLSLSKAENAYLACFLVAICFFLPRGVSTPFFMVCGFLFFYVAYSYAFRVRQ